MLIRPYHFQAAILIGMSMNSNNCPPPYVYNIKIARFQTYLNVLATQLLHYLWREHSGRKGSPIGK
jgi:hypothetical protein